MDNQAPKKGNLMKSGIVGATTSSIFIATLVLQRANK
jgi:hypothetical protein